MRRRSASDDTIARQRARVESEPPDRTSWLGREGANLRKPATLRQAYASDAPRVSGLTETTTTRLDVSRRAVARQRRRCGEPKPARATRAPPPETNLEEHSNAQAERVLRHRQVSLTTAHARRGHAGDDGILTLDGALEGVHVEERRGIPDYSSPPISSILNTGPSLHM